MLAIVLEHPPAVKKYRKVTENWKQPDVRRCLKDSPIRW
jgi:hypothetical protein